MEVYEEFLQSGGDPNASDSYTINGQPGALQPCSASAIYVNSREPGKYSTIRQGKKERSQRKWALLVGSFPSLPWLGSLYFCGKRSSIHKAVYQQHHLDCKWNVPWSNSSCQHRRYHHC
ncbi:hypothetical protein HS088_TW15G00876 [Tripterygium wilfordii]|uniref:Uncharacterized protein n=1 Tax=Tripterygium wilfordii TaxID=458696 RepID=A0A7J7CMS2_TRIWF|nr:hypothetical protein HS088_TW15G00876 [Tripterygium wilfordii]